MPFPLIPILIGAALGAGSGALGGGKDKKDKKSNILKGAIIGAATGGIGGWAAGAGKAGVAAAGNTAALESAKAGVSTKALAGLPAASGQGLAKSAATGIGSKFMQFANSTPGNALTVGALNSVFNKEDQAQPPVIPDNAPMQFNTAPTTQISTPLALAGNDPYLEMMRRRQMLGGMGGMYGY